eukprot:364409-Chlamydomonas_euryale.AAC.13
MACATYPDGCPQRWLSMSGVPKVAWRFKVQLHEALREQLLPLVFVRQVLVAALQPLSGLLSALAGTASNEELNKAGLWSQHEFQ